jgi:hypothetical protein
MKCGAYLTLKKRKGKDKIERRKTVGQYEVELGAREPPEGSVVCDGDITATVETVYDGGGLDAALGITYRCGKCGIETFPELPSTEEELSAFLTEQVARMTKKQRKQRFVALRKARKAVDQRMVELAKRIRTELPGRIDGRLGKT